MAAFVTAATYAEESAMTSRKQNHSYESGLGTFLSGIKTQGGMKDSL